MPAPSGPSNFKILFAGGGTGGHLTPGLSVAEELRCRFPESRCVFVGTSGFLEREIVRGKNFEHVSLPSLKWDRSPLSVPRWAARSGLGLIAARKLIREVRPDLVVSLGAHAALAPSVAARLSNIPLAVMEQNAYPGKVNRLLSWWAQEVYVPWSGAETFFAYPGRVHVTGNPVRGEFVRHAERDVVGRFGLSHRKRTLFVTGGSQGAQFINRVVLDALPLLEPESSWLQILHHTGEDGYEEALAAYGRSGMQAAVHPFIEDMSAAYGGCDLALCRAGGTTLAELTALGVPAVLVPLPIAADDHQRCNASKVAGHGAALIVDQDDLAAGRLADIVLKLLRNDACLSRMRAASRRLGRPGATQNVMSRLLGLLARGTSHQRIHPVAAATVEEG